MEQFFESKLGKYFVIAYTLFTMLVYFYVFVCTGISCNVYIVVPIMPWALILVRDLGMTFPLALYPVFILLNTSIAYFVGAVLEGLYVRYKDYKEDKNNI
jgi:hypothetical protein